MEEYQPLTAKEAALLGAEADRPPFDREGDKQHVIASTLRRLNEIAGRGEHTESSPDPISHLGLARAQMDLANTAINPSHHGDMTLRDIILTDERQSRTPGPNQYFQSADTFWPSDSLDRPSMPSPLSRTGSPAGYGASNQQGVPYAGSDDLSDAGLPANDVLGRAKPPARTSIQSSKASSPMAPDPSVETSSIPQARFRVELEASSTDDDDTFDVANTALDDSKSADGSYDDADDDSDNDSSPSDIGGFSPSSMSESGGMASRMTNSAEAANSEPRQVNVSVQVDVEVSVARLDKIVDAATRKAAILAENLIDRKLSDERRDDFMREASRRACL
jgi:hypothetical protein